MTDMDLIQRAVNLNDQTAFSELMKRYHEPIRVFIVRLVQNLDDADDLTNLSFEKAFRSLPNYRPDYPFSTWLFTIAKNTAIDFGRKRTIPTQPLHSKSANSEKVHEFPLADQDLNPEQNLIRDQKNAEIRALVADLKPDFKLMVELFYFEGLGIEEIAEKTKKPAGTVKANLSRARVILQQKLTRKRPN